METELDEVKGLIGSSEATFQRDFIRANNRDGLP